MIMYDYKLTFNIYIKNNAMKKEVLIIKKRVETLYDL